LAVRARTILARARRESGQGNRDVEERDLRHGLAVLEQSGYRSLEPALRVELAELAGARGDAATRANELAAARRILEEMGAGEQAHLRLKT
jgi:hypothetical protein